MPENAYGWSIAPCWGVDRVLIGCRIFRQIFGRECFASELIAKHRTISVQRKPHAIIPSSKARNSRLRRKFIDRAGLFLTKYRAFLSVFEFKLRSFRVDAPGRKPRLARMLATISIWIFVNSKAFARGAEITPDVP